MERIRIFILFANNKEEIKIMEDIVIKREKENLFEVVQGEKSSGPLFYEEVLGLVSSLIMPEGRPCNQWMRTKEERDMLFSNKVEKTK